MNHLFETDWAPICWLKQKCTYFSQNKIRWNKKNLMIYLRWMASLATKSCYISAIGLRFLMYATFALRQWCWYHCSVGASCKLHRATVYQANRKNVAPVWRGSSLNWAVLGQNGRSRGLDWPVQRNLTGRPRTKLDGDIWQKLLSLWKKTGRRKRFKVGRLCINFSETVYFVCLGPPNSDLARSWDAAAIAAVFKPTIWYL